MNLFKTAAAALAAFTLIGSAQAVDGARITLRLVNDGVLVATPALLVAFGQPAATEAKAITGVYRVELVAEEKGAGTNVAVRLWADSGKGAQLIGDTVLPLMPGIAATVNAMNDKSTVNLSVEATRVPLNEQPGVVPEKG